MKQAAVVALLWALCLSVFVGLNGLAHDPLSRLDPVLRSLILAPEGAPLPQPAALGQTSILGEYQISLAPSAGDERIGVLAKVRGSVEASSFLGYPVRGEAGSVLSLSIPLSELLQFAASDEVIYVEAAWRTRPTLDASIPAIGAASVHAPPSSLLGENVIVGIVDTGVDYSHLDFRFDSDGNGIEESSRILAILDQTDGLYGMEYSRAQIESDLALGHGSNAGEVRQSDDDGHGTHIASIAAGDGSSSSQGFVGVAPEAWIIVVKTSFFTSDILSGVDYVFDQADMLGLPAVVNLSLGGHDGPHDGTSLFEQGLDELASRPGRLIVVSAGNEGDQSIHAAATLQGTAHEFDLEIANWEAEASLWYPGSSQFTITIVPPTDAPIVVPTGTSSGYVTTSNGIAYVDNASTGAHPGNGDHEAYIRLSGVSSGDRWRIVVRDDGGGGRFDAWLISNAGSFVGGDSSSTIDEPGNARGVLTVGSFNSKGSWPSLAGPQDESATYAVGALSSFSSHGPTRDGRTKPEICAPGAWIAAALSADAYQFSYLTHPDGVHAMELGTSMAAPHVSGAVALLLSLDSTLTTSEVRSILTGTAARNANTGSVPNPSWGWGKLDVASAIQSMGPVGPPPEVSSIPIRVAENPVRAKALFVYSTPDETAWASLRVFSISGRLLFEREVNPRSPAFEWDLRTNEGETLAAGLYLFVLVSDLGASAVGKLVIEP